MLGMKTMGTVVVAQAMQLMKSVGTKISSKSSMPDNCIIIKGEVLECRDSLTQVFRLPNDICRLINERSQLQQFVSKFRNSNEKYLKIKESVINQVVYVGFPP